MVNYWVFVSVEYGSYSIDSVKDVIKRIRKTGKWYIGPHTANRNNIQKGDKIIIYQVGEDGKKFIGSATINSELKSDREDPYDYIVLSDVRIWKMPLEIPSVINNMSFFANRKRWGSRFQAGISKLPERDYLYLVRVTQ